jgi:hypothetical protein
MGKRKLLTNKASFVSRDVQGDGSCFFRALFCVAQKHHVLNVLCLALKIEYTKNVDVFIKHVRCHLANCIKERKDINVVTRIYATLESMDKDSYAAIIKTSFPSWLSSQMKQLPSNEAKFRGILAKGVIDKTSWVSQIEVELIVKWARREGIEIVILNKEPKEQLVFKRKTLYLLNVDEVHYKYMAYVERSKEMMMMRR